MSAPEQLTDLAKAAPPLAITGMSFFGFPVSDWAFALTALYSALQIVSLLRKWITDRRITPTTCVKDCSNRIRG